MSDNARALRALASARRAIDDAESALRSSGIVQSATVDKAMAFVLETVRDRPRELSTSALRRLARGRRLSNEALSRAIDALHREGTINYERGARSSRLWYVVNVGESAPPSLPGIASTNENAAAEHSDGLDTSSPQNGTEADASAAMESSNA